MALASNNEPKAQITRLMVYVEKLKQQIASAKTPGKKDFFERDLKKTLSKIDKLK